MAVFASKKIILSKIPAVIIPVTITGSGGSQQLCSVTINGKKYNSSTATEVSPNDIIGFSITSDMGTPGYIKINGSTVLETPGGIATTKTYDWTVPEGTNSITINLSTNTSFTGNITVTTK